MQTTRNDPKSPVRVRRKHRPGLQRIQIACERCRARKNKCDGQAPQCSACRKAGLECTITDRLSHRQYPRDHVEDLEIREERLQRHVQQLQLENEKLKAAIGGLQNEVLYHGTQPSESTEASTHFATQINDFVSFDNADVHSKVSSNDVLSDVGLSTPSFFGIPLLNGSNVVGNRHQRSWPDARSGMSRGKSSQYPIEPNDNIFPTDEVGDALQDAYFAHRWPALPFLHRSSFEERHFAPCLTLKWRADKVSLFLSLMVMALGAIDMSRLGLDSHIDHQHYFALAVEYCSQALANANDLETIQGFLLVAQYAINESRSVSSWHVTGQAIRMCIDQGLHRQTNAESNDIIFAEMKKRVFWCAYSIDRNVSIALGRPCAIADSEFDVPMPRPLIDETMTGRSPQQPAQDGRISSRLDVATFIHIARLRMIQSRIQTIFYPAVAPDESKIMANELRADFRAQLDQWLASSPSGSTLVTSTFESSEWFQIAYSHSILLLYRPSPLGPEMDQTMLDICAESAISLISSYSSLYAKKKITYTWIALHALFMASVTMLWTIWISPEIRSKTRKNVVRSNVMSCLALFDVMGDTWPLASRCYEIFDRLGNATLALYTSTDNTDLRDIQSPGGKHNLQQIDAEFITLFADRELAGLSRETTKEQTSISFDLARGNNLDPTVHFAPTIPQAYAFGDLTSIDPHLEDDFDPGINLMMIAFGTKPYLDFSV